MKIFTRIVMVLALLGGLGYGSYAFGRYVLTNKLFGESSVRSAAAHTDDQAAAVTYHTKWKGDKPRVEVKLLPANGEGPPTDVTDGSKSTGVTLDLSLIHI